MAGCDHGQRYNFKKVGAYVVGSYQNILVQLIPSRVGKEEMLYV